MHTPQFQHTHLVKLDSWFAARTAAEMSASQSVASPLKKRRPFSDTTTRRFTRQLSSYQPSPARLWDEKPVQTCYDVMIRLVLQRAIGSLRAQCSWFYKIESQNFNKSNIFKLEWCSSGNLKSIFFASKTLHSDVKMRNLPKWQFILSFSCKRLLNPIKKWAYVRNRAEGKSKPCRLSTYEYSVTPAISGTDRPPHHSRPVSPHLFFNISGSPL